MIETDEDAPETLVIEARVDTFDRALDMGLGAFLIGGGLWLLWTEFPSDPSSVAGVLLTALLVLLAGGTAWFGRFFLRRGLRAEHVHWTLTRHGSLTLRRTSPFRLGERVDAFGPPDFRGTEVRNYGFDGNDTWRVALIFRSGDSLETPDYGSIDDARAIENDICRRLRLAPPARETSHAPAH